MMDTFEDFAALENRRKYIRHQRQTMEAERMAQIQEIQSAMDDKKLIITKSTKRFAVIYDFYTRNGNHVGIKKDITSILVYFNGDFCFDISDHTMESWLSICEERVKEREKAEALAKKTLVTTMRSVFSHAR